MFSRFSTNGAGHLINLIMGCSMGMLKRSISALIDVYFIRFLTVAVYCVTVSISHLVCNKTIYYAAGRFIRRAVYLVALYIVVMLCTHFLYFFLSEWRGTSLGKRLTKYETDYERAENRQAALVALCKTGACVLYLVTVPYFLIKKKMPYDKIRRGNRDAINQHKND